MKKRLLHGFGLALVLASPLWITLEEHPNYFNFGISIILGILLLVLASADSKAKQPDRKGGRD